MIVKMKRQEFDSLAGEALFNACFEPLIMDYKRRMANLKDDWSQGKEIFYQELTTGQKALFVFHMYYDHAIESKAEFFWWSAYFLAQPKIWSAIKLGIWHFKEEHMYWLLEEIELVLKRHNCHSTLEDFTIVREDLDRNRELFESINPLNIDFIKTAPLTIKRISDFIRSKHEDFVEIVA